MTSYSFKARFAEPILDGSKGGTIRAPRREPLRAATGPLRYRDHVGGHALPGEQLQLYTGMRTKQCRLIARKICIAVEPITLVFDPGWWIRIGTLEEHIDTRGEALNAFARFDGFENWADMQRFWAGSRNFTGWHIRWMPLPQEFVS